MPAHRARRATAILDSWLPYPATLLLVVVVVAVSLCLVGSTQPPLPTTGVPTGTVTITPDDPAAAHPTAAQLLGR